MLFIPFNTPSKKNSKIFSSKTKKLFSSKTTREYEKNVKEFFENKDNLYLFKELVSGTTDPIYLGIYFVRKEDRSFDYNNISQVICDLMVKYQWIQDDNAKFVVPVFLGYKKNKENAGAYITVLNDNKILMNEYKKLREYYEQATEPDYPKPKK